MEDVKSKLEKIWQSNAFSASLSFEEWLQQVKKRLDLLHIPYSNFSEVYEALTETDFEDLFKTF